MAFRLWGKTYSCQKPEEQCPKFREHVTVIYEFTTPVIIFWSLFPPLFPFRTESGVTNCATLMREIPYTFVPERAIIYPPPKISWTEKLQKVSYFTSGVHIKTKTISWWYKNTFVPQNAPTPKRCTKHVYQVHKFYGFSWMHFFTQGALKSTFQPVLLCANDYWNDALFAENGWSTHTVLLLATFAKTNQIVHLSKF